MLKRMEQIVLELITFGTVQILKIHHVLIKPSIERCCVLLIKVVQLIKAAIILAQIKLGLIGLQLQIIAHKIRQRVLSLLKRGS